MSCLDIKNALGAILLMLCGPMGASADTASGKPSVVSPPAVSGLDLPVASNAEGAKPNIILIIADDVGYGDFDVTGSDQRPHGLLDPNEKG